MNDDTISRQAAIDALLHNQKVYSNNFGTDAIDKYTIAIIDNDAQTIAQLPSAQPKIIRCKDCKHNRRLECPFGITVFDAPKDDEFCSRAERRTDE